MPSLGVYTLRTDTLGLHLKARATRFGPGHSLTGDLHSGRRHFGCLEVRATRCGSGYVPNGGRHSRNRFCGVWKLGQPDLDLVVHSVGVYTREKLMLPDLVLAMHSLGGDTLRVDSLRSRSWGQQMLRVDTEGSLGARATGFGSGQAFHLHSGNRHLGCQCVGYQIWIWSCTHWESVYTLGIGLPDWDLVILSLEVYTLRLDPLVL